ncbi:AAA family ATPase [Nordella sp. HKS 07]|uniref:adenylate/guanylate cyclase domain-containing protein n=1 Tax=Nordella sp. HKS 07 TaxID=2712222 RepID=UPI0013E1FF53|nr:adenylate/guanylate cyclase domain-containing protein [Nordella sp. HKS 07]QIG51009.1 AAA family ATPase [Nordella sp. HKS 07]
MDIVAWLTDLGLERYAEHFAANEIDETTLRALDDEDLKELGVSALGHRKKLVLAIAELGRSSSEGGPAVAAGILDGARRQVTVLFADISGFTRLSRELGAEATHDLLNRYFGVVDGIVEGYGGTIDKHIGDNVMAVFGAPKAHSDDPERAVRAACEIHEAVSRSGNGALEALRVHIGIASGQVVASGTGSDAHREYTITGDSVNLASRLQDVAQAGETWVSESLQRAIGRMAICERMVEIEVKGFAQPVRAGRLVGLRSELDESDSIPFVGRRSEMAQFISILTNCRDTGNGQTIYVRGDAGIGKTRLIAELKRLAEEQEFACHIGFLLDFGVARGQDAIRLIVRSLLDFAPSSDLKAHDAAAARAVAEGLVGAEARIFLNDLLGLPQPPDLAGIYDAMDNTSRNDGKRRTVVGLVRAAAAKRPVVIVVEDLHWASTMELRHLAALARAVNDIPALLVMTSRFDGDPINQSWRAAAGNGTLTTIDLGPLRQAEALELAAGFFDAGNRLALDCVERAEGNPLFLDQLLRNAQEADAAELPASVQSLVQARVDRLGQADRLALQAASVVGQRFTPDAVAHLIDDPLYDFEPLLRNSLIRPEGDAFLFAHALIRDGVYSSLLTARRNVLHRLAADWFRKSDPILRAEHLDRAEDAAAAEAYLHAAKAELHQFHFERAAGLVKRGLEIVRDLSMRYDLTCLHGNILRELGEAEKSIEAFENALETAGSDSQRLTAWIGQVEGMRIADRYDEALSVLRRAESVASADCQAGQLAQIHFLRGNIYFPMANIDGCLEQHELALKFAQDAGSAKAEARALGGLGDAHYQRGYMITANQHFRKCVDLSRENGYGRIALANLYMIGYTARYANRLQEALKIALETIDAATTVGNRRAELGGRFLAFTILVEMAEFGSAQKEITEAEILLERLGPRRFEAQLLIFRSIVLRSEGRRNEAIGACTRAIQIARDTGLAFVGPWAMAEFAANIGDPKARSEALAEGERTLAAGAVSHCHFHFYTTAMEACLQSGEWDEVNRYAGALESFTRPEPLPWCDFFIASGRALSRYGQGQRDEEIRNQLLRLQRTASDAGLRLANRRIEATLAAW